MREDTKPWYKYPWPWVLIAIPVFTALKAVHTVVVMQQHKPEIVIDDYYTEGKNINLQLSKYREAALRNMDARILVAGNRAVIRFTENQVLGDKIHLDFYHPTLSAQDFAVDAERSGELLYVATLPKTPNGRWRLTVSDDSEEWRLRANLTLPSEQEIKLGY